MAHNKKVRKTAGTSRALEANENLARLATDVRSMELLLKMQRQLVLDFQQTASRLVRRSQSSPRTK